MPTNSDPTSEPDSLIVLTPVPRRNAKRLALEPKRLTGSWDTDKYITDMAVAAFEGFRREREASLDADRLGKKASCHFHRNMARSYMHDLMVLLRLCEKHDPKRFGLYLGCKHYPCPPHDVIP